MLQREVVRFRATPLQPNPLEVDYWIDLSSNRFGGVLRYYRNDTETWEKLQADSGPINDNLYQNLLELINKLINDIDSKLEQLKEYLQNYTNEQINSAITPINQQITDINQQLSNIQTGVSDEDFVALLRTHIDNDTVYWEESIRAIKAKGGSSGSDEVFTITVDIDESQGIRGKVLPGKINKVIKGQNLTITIVPNQGYQVMRVNVDKVNQGPITEYTFENVQENHTMYVWFVKEEELNPVDWLERDDKPGTVYSSMQAALNAIKADYPDKLTRDVTVRCIKDEVRYKNKTMWVGELKRWNIDSMYSLIIDMENKVTFNCGSLGGFHFDHVDNVVVRNVKFINLANFIEAYVPEQLAAVYFSGSIDHYAKNLLVQNCTANGKSVYKDQQGQYAFILKYFENVTLDRVYTTDFNCTSLIATDGKIFNVTNSYINSSISYGIIGHPMLCWLSNCDIVNFEDNTFTGTVGERMFDITNAEYIYFRRNKLVDCHAEGILIQNKVAVKKAVFEYNLFAGLLKQPSIAWGFHYINLGTTINELTINNNTVYMSSTWWQQWFLRGQSQHIDVLNLNNNIFVDATPNSVPNRGISLGTIGTLNSSNNIYQWKIDSNGNPSQGWFYSTTYKGKLSEMQAMGFEVGSKILNVNEPLLQNQQGGNSFELIASLAGLHLANPSVLPEFDITYKKKSAVKNTVGCYNTYGVEFDESQDNTQGYTGINTANDELFSNSAQYSTYAMDTLYLKHNTQNRNKVLKISLIGTNPANKRLIFGKYCVFELLPILNNKQEYLQDEIYDVKIEDL